MVVHRSRTMRASRSNRCFPPELDRRFTVQDFGTPRARNTFLRHFGHQKLPGSRVASREAPPTRLQCWEVGDCLGGWDGDWPGRNFSITNSSAICRSSSCRLVSPSASSRAAPVTGDPTARREDGLTSAVQPTSSPPNKQQQQQQHGKPSPKLQSKCVGKYGAPIPKPLRPVVCAVMHP